MGVPFEVAVNYPQIAIYYNVTETNFERYKERTR